MRRRDGWFDGVIVGANFVCALENALEGRLGEAMTNFAVFAIFVALRFIPEKK